MNDDGIDMTPEMVAKAQATAEALGCAGRG